MLKKYLTLLQFFRAIFVVRKFELSSHLYTSNRNHEPKPELTTMNLPSLSFRPDQEPSEKHDKKPTIKTRILILESKPSKFPQLSCFFPSHLVPNILGFLAPLQLFFFRCFHGFVYFFIVIFVSMITVSSNRSATLLIRFVSIFGCSNSRVPCQFSSMLLSSLKLFIHLLKRALCFTLFLAGYFPLFTFFVSRFKRGHHHFALSPPPPSLSSTSNKVESSLS